MRHVLSKQIKNYKLNIFHFSHTLLYQRKINMIGSGKPNEKRKLKDLFFPFFSSTKS